MSAILISSNMLLSDGSLVEFIQAAEQTKNFTFKKVDDKLSEYGMIYIFKFHNMKALRNIKKQFPILCLFRSYKQFINRMNIIYASATLEWHEMPYI